MDEQGQCLECFYVALAKYKGVMRLCYGEADEDCCYPDDSEPDWKPVVECSLDVRLEVARHIAKLPEKAIEAAEASIPKVQAAIAALRG